MPRVGEVEVDCAEIRNLICFRCKLQPADAERQMNITHSVFHKMMGGLGGRRHKSVIVKIEQANEIIMLARRILSASEEEINLEIIKWKPDDQNIPSYIRTYKSNTNLEILKVSFTHDAELDIYLRNNGPVDLVIFSISVKKIIDYKDSLLPILQPSAKYHLSVDDIEVGSKKSIEISHLVAARSADRILISLDTTNIYLLRVEFELDNGMRAEFDFTTWTYIAK